MLKSGSGTHADKNDAGQALKGLPRYGLGLRWGENRRIGAALTGDGKLALN